VQSDSIFVLDYRPGYPLLHILQAYDWDYMIRFLNSMNRKMSAQLQSLELNEAKARSKKGEHSMAKIKKAKLKPVKQGTKSVAAKTKKAPAKKAK
jgi:hypothetical protein